MNNCGKGSCEPQNQVCSTHYHGSCATHERQGSGFQERNESSAIDKLVEEVNENFQELQEEIEENFESLQEEIEENFEAVHEDIEELEDKLEGFEDMQEKIEELEQKVLRLEKLISKR